MTPLETKTLTQTINNELKPISAKLHNEVPIQDIDAILRGNNLDSKPVERAFRSSPEGRVHVYVGNGVYLTLTWYKFSSSGKFEILAYASSNHDDLPNPVKSMDNNAKRKAMSAVNKALTEVGKKYWQGVGAPMKQVADALEKEGFSAHELQGHIITGEQGNLHVPVGNGVYLSFFYYKMPSENYEITAYIN